MNEETYMQLAIELAKKGCGRTAPNPMVGAVIVKEGRIIGQGWHEQYGQPHAERNALANCMESPKGATMYVTLEPCCHYGKQPPCTDAIIEAGIRHVVVGSNDPNPLVHGGGIKKLREHGILVTEGVCKEQCDQLNEVFFHYIRTGKPFVVMKYAMTMDGKIAAYTGLSQWITGDEARAHVHQQRNRYSAIMAGVGTVLSDDPLLTCRMEGGRNPIRIICDSKLRTPLSSRIVQTAKEVPTILATCCTEESRHRSYQEAGCRTLQVKEKDGRIDLQELMERLGAERIDSILLEGGAELNWSALQEGVVQKVQAYIAPKLFGGQTAKSPIAGQGVAAPKEAVRLKNTAFTRLGDDFLLESEVVTDVYGDC